MSSPLTTTTPPPPRDQHKKNDEKTVAQQLPRYIILKSKHNDNYLRLVDETLLQYTGPNGVKCLDVQFEIEVAATDEKFVHIRNLRNNRYLEFNQSTKFFTATGVKKVESLETSECTMLEPILVSRADNSYRLRHAFKNYYVSMRSGINLEATGNVTGTVAEVHLIVDSESILVLPRYVAFKGSEDNKYLKTYTDDFDPSKESPVLAFYGNGITDPYVTNEILPGTDGRFRIRNVDTGLYWTKDATANYFRITRGSGSWFSPEKIGNKIIALRYNGRYCGCAQTSGTECYFRVLNEGSQEDNVVRKDKYVRLEVEEPVVRRVISDISYNEFKNKRIYNEKRLLVANGEAVNRSTVENEFEMNIKYSDSKTRTYNHNLSLKLATKFTVKASFIPCIVDGKIGFSGEVCGEKEWGNLTGFTKTVSKALEVPVTKKSTRRLSVTATQGWCDIPYTYTQTDTLINGEMKTFEKMEGVYKGANVYKMEWDIGHSKELPQT